MPSQYYTSVSLKLVPNMVDARAANPVVRTPDLFRHQLRPCLDPECKVLGCHIGYYIEVLHVVLGY